MPLKLSANTPAGKLTPPAVTLPLTGTPKLVLLLTDSAVLRCAARAMVGELTTTGAWPGNTPFNEPRLNCPATFDRAEAIAAFCAAVVLTLGEAVAVKTELVAVKAVLIKAGGSGRVGLLVN